MADNHTDWRTWPTGDRAGIAVGAYFANLDTKVGLGTSELGTIIDFEGDLGLEDSKTRPLVSGFWRISKRNKLSIEYYKLDRSADYVVEREIIIPPDIDIEPGDGVQSFFDVQTTTINYSFSFVMRERHDLFAGLGLSWQNYKIGIRDVNDVQQSISFKASAPLPAINVGYNFAFNDKWVWRNKIGGLVVSADLDSDVKFSGSVWDGATGIEWRVWDYISLAASYKFFRVDVDATDKPTDVTAAIKYLYHGPAITIAARF